MFERSHLRVSRYRKLALEPDQLRISTKQSGVSYAWRLLLSPCARYRLPETGRSSRYFGPVWRFRCVDRHYTLKCSTRNHQRRCVIPLR
jgi:hypothetical protein